MTAEPGKVFAISDLHVTYPENRDWVERVAPDSPEDWLIVAGDVAEKTATVEWALRTLKSKFRTVLWVPGNHELWTLPSDPVQLRGEQRYRYLVELCRRLGVITPEDPYPVWHGSEGPVVIAPLFLLYDYTFLPPGATTKQEALRLAYETGIVCTDEMLLHPDPYPSRDAWCRARIVATEQRLAAVDQRYDTILVNHFPLTREPTAVLKYKEFAQWCGSELTATWHLRFRARTVVYGHLHIHRTSWQDGVRFEEVSLGHPEEQQRRPERPRRLTQILPAPVADSSAMPLGRSHEHR
jgi:3',5'-cyclic AMP phosphodiesterase CpdA